jgi:neutral ceramidase
VKARKNDLLIGIASADITPPVGISMPGYGLRTSTSLGHPLRAEALVVRGAGGSWALVTSDVIGYQGPYVAGIRQAVAERTSLKPEAILISAIHTHSGPATTGFGAEIQPIDAEYNASLAGTLADLIVAADAAAEPGHFEVAWTEAGELASNRRVQAADGTWTNEWRDPQGLHSGFVDPAVLLVAVRRDDGRCDGLLVNYGCHPVVLGSKSLAISADYVGYLKDALEASGLTKKAMFALAGGANINPRVCIQVGPEQPKAMGERLAEIVASAARKLRPIAGGAVTSHRQPWELTRVRAANWPGGGVGTIIATEIQALRAGDLGLIAIPGELFSEYNAMLRKVSPTPHTVVISLANDYIGYLPTDEAIVQGAYETSHCPTDVLEEALMDAARGVLSGL